MVRRDDSIIQLNGLCRYATEAKLKPTEFERAPSRTLPFFLATKNHKSHKPDDLLTRTFKLFVDFVPFRGYKVAIPYNRQVSTRFVP